MPRRTFDPVSAAADLVRAALLAPARAREARRLRGVASAHGLAVLSAGHRPHIERSVAAAVAGLRAGIYRALPDPETGGAPARDVVTLVPDRGTRGARRRHPVIRLGRALHPGIGHGPADGAEAADGTDGAAPFTPVDPSVLALSILTTPRAHALAARRIRELLDALASLEAQVHGASGEGALHEEAIAFVAVAATPWVPAVSGQTGGSSALVDPRHDARTSAPLAPRAPAVDPTTLGVPPCVNLHAGHSTERHVGMIAIGPMHGSWHVNPFDPDLGGDLDPMEAMRNLDALRVVPPAYVLPDDLDASAPVSETLRGPRWPDAPRLRLPPSDDGWTGA